MGATAIALAIGSAPTPGAIANAEEGVGGPKGLDALVLGKADSPVLTALRRQTNFDSVQSSDASTLRPRPYDLLVVDGDAHATDYLKSQPLIERFTNDGRWIMVLDASRSDRATLESYTGLHVSDSPGGTGSAMFLFGISRAESEPRMVIVDAGRLAPLGASDLGPRRLEQIKDDEARHAADVALSRISADRAATPGPSKQAAETATACQTTLCGDSLQHAGWTYTPLDTQANLTNGFWIQDRKCCSLFTLPDPGKQTSTWTFNHKVDVYLDNDTNPLGDDQVVLYQLGGGFTPALNQQFFQMFKPFGLLFNPADYFFERAWWTGMIEPKVTPLGADTRLAPYELAGPSSEPLTRNTETGYDIAKSFTIGINAAAPSAGGGVPASYSVSRGEHITIPDWDWQNRSGGNGFSWQFSARQPCDVRPTNLDYGGCFAYGVLHDDAKRPPDIDLDRMRVGVSGRWIACAPNPQDCQRPLTGDDGKISLRFDTPVTLIDTFCKPYAPSSRARIVCPNLNRQTTGPKPFTESVNVAAVNPCPASEPTCTPIKRVELFHCLPSSERTCRGPDEGKPVRDGSPANGWDKEPISGRVVLAKKVDNPLGVKVVLYSSDRSATFSNGEQRDAIKVDNGHDSGSFTLFTNGNDLRCPNDLRRTVNVSAFYVKAPREPAQMDVVRPPASCQG